MPNNATSKTINAALLKRFGAEFEIDPELTGLNELEKIAGHRSHRRYLPRPIEPDLLHLCPVQKRSPTMRYHHRQRRHDTKVHCVFYPGDAVDR
jgi:hypothetical protein